MLMSNHINMLPVLPSLAMLFLITTGVQSPMSVVSGQELTVLLQLGQSSSTQTSGEPPVHLNSDPAHDLSFERHFESCNAMVARSQVSAQGVQLSPER